MERDQPTTETPLRRLLARNLGNEVTPELAARIEAAAGHGGNPVDLSQFRPVRCGRLVFRAESFREVVEELHKLHLDHWAETEQTEYRQSYQDLVRRERLGDLVQFTARDGAELVGHIRSHLGWRAHTLERFATEDLVYLSPGYRAGRNLPRFVQYTERCLKQIDVQQVRIQAAHRFGLAGLAQLLGYRPTHTVLIKDLGDSHVF